MAAFTECNMTDCARGILFNLISLDDGYTRPGVLTYTGYVFFKAHFRSLPGRVAVVVADEGRQLLIVPGLLQSDFNQKRIRNCHSWSDGYYPNSWCVFNAACLGPQAAV